MSPLSTSEQDTVNIARTLACTLKPGDMICLQGNLGAGKTVFARALIRALCGDDTMDVPSPTFTLVETYELPDDQTLWHFDLYRLEEPEEIYELGWEEALSTDAIMVVEWPERLGGLTPQNHINIHINTDPDSPDHRHIHIQHHEKP